MGRGRGRQVVSVAKTADVIIIMSKFEQQLFCRAGADWMGGRYSGRYEICGTKTTARTRIGSCRYSIKHGSSR
jgi:hypothetical protein